jgi:hypothetical protein
MSIKYRVILTNEEREQLSQLIQKGSTQGYRIRHAQILLALDEIEANKEWTDRKISVAYHTTEKSIYNMRRRFVEQGFSSALERQKRATPPNIKIDGETEAKIIALTCSDASDGHSRWTLRLLAEKIVELGIMENVSHTAIADLLKKTKLNHGYKKNGAFQNHLQNL